MSSARNRKGDGPAATYTMPPSKEERSFMTFLWNPKTKTVMGRTGTSWAKIGFFYVVFYLCLAGYFSILMAIFYRTLNFHAPKLTGEDSILKNPGLGLRPRAYGGDNLKPTITYNPSDPKSYAPYIDSISKFWEVYASQRPNAMECLPSDGYREEDGPVCFFYVDEVDLLCSPDNLWGYNTTSPCLFLKLNKMFYWKPQPLQGVEGLPKGLQQYINASSDPQELEQNAWVWCESDDVELEQLAPKLPLRYFPYLNQEGYLAPFVAVRLVNVTAETKVEVKCRAWADNIKHDDPYSPKTAELKILVHHVLE